MKNIFTIIKIIDYIMTDNSEQIMKLRITSNDGSETIVDVPQSIFEKMSTLNDMVLDMSELGDVPHDVIDIPPNTIDLDTLNMVIEYYQRYQVSENPSENALMDWETEFFEQLGNETFETLSRLLPAANYLNCSELLNKGCKYVARVIIKNKTVEELRDYFGVENDFTPEEEDKIREDFAWAIDQE